MNRLKAQQVIEFMLAAPILILFFAVLTEFAFAFNANLVFSNAVKSSVSAYLSAISLDAKNNDYKTAVEHYVLTDMQKNGIPNLESLDISLIQVGDYMASVGSYTYKPGFTFAFFPALREFHMNAISVFPLSKVEIDGYQNGLSTEELNAIQPSPEAPAENDGVE